MLKDVDDIKNFIQNDNFMMTALKTAKSLNLPSWFIGAGFVRDTIWNIQHGFDVDYKLKALDVGYYDPDQKLEVVDEKISRELKKILDVNWEVVNQAYAHKYNGVSPYKSAIDGLAHWVETATSVGATLDKDDNVIILAPWGVEDLLELKLRLSPCHTGNKYYEKLFFDRIQKKNWLNRWPKLTVV